MAERRIESIRIIVREHLDGDELEKAMAELKGIEVMGSSVGIKVSINGELYGEFVRCKPSTLTAEEIVEIVNIQFDHLLKELEGNNG